MTQKSVCIVCLYVCLSICARTQLGPSPHCRYRGFAHGLHLQTVFNGSNAISMAQNARYEHQSHTIPQDPLLSRLEKPDTDLAVTLLQASRRSASKDGQKPRSLPAFQDVSLLVLSAVPLRTL